MGRSHRRLSLALAFLCFGLLAGGGYLLRRMPRLSPAAPSASALAQEATPASTEAPEPLPEAAAPPPVDSSPPTPATKEVAIPPTVAIRGTLLDADGSPLPFARVEAYAWSMRRVFAKVVSETDEKGAFRADCPVWSHVTFTAHLPGRGRAFNSLTVTDAEHLLFATTEFTMKFSSGTTREGTLHDAAGRPVAGARLRFHPMSSPFHDAGVTFEMNLLNGRIPPDKGWDEQCERALYLTDYEGSTAPDGSFRADSLLPGVRYVVEVLREGREGERVEARTLRPGPLLLRLAP